MYFIKKFIFCLTLAGLLQVLIWFNEFQFKNISLKNVKMPEPKETKADELVEKLISSLINVLQGGRVTHLHASTLSRFSGRPTSSGELSLAKWLGEVDIYCDECNISESKKAQVILNHLDGDARQEVKCHSTSSPDLESLLKLLKRYFGSKDTSQSLQKKFHERVQQEGESLDQFSRALMCLYDDIIDVTISDSEKQAFKGLRESSLIDRFVAGASSPALRLELRRIQLANSGKSFLEVRDHALDLLDQFDSKPSKAKWSFVHEVSVEDRPSETEAAVLCAEQDVIDQLLQQQATLSQCMQKQQVILERQQEQIAELIAAQNSQPRVPVERRRRKRVLNCFYCGKPGHIQAKCWAFQQANFNSNVAPVNEVTCNVPFDSAPPGVFPSLSPRQMTALQRSDPVLKLVWKRWDHGWNPGDPVVGSEREPIELKRWLWQWSRIVEKDGVLCRHVNDPIHGEICQVLLPECLRSQVLEGSHDGWGHQGVNRIFAILRKQVYWPKMLTSVRNHIGHCTQCHEPLFPFDQILGRTDCDLGKEFVKQQSELLERANEIVQNRIKQSAQHNKVLHDDRAPSLGRVIPTGTQVLLKKCAFSGRHKIQDVYESDRYVVVWHNEEEDVYAIRPVKGGNEKVVNRRLLRVDPVVQNHVEELSSKERGENSGVRVDEEKVGESPCNTDSSDDSESEEIIMMGFTQRENQESDVDREKVGEPATVVPVLRRSTRSTRGRNLNPFRLPQSSVR